MLCRLGSHIPIPGIDTLKLDALFNSNNVLGFVDLFSGGALSRFSVFALGILPFINASIIIQLLMIIIPSLKELAEEGESGRKQIAQYTRYLAVGLSIFQSFIMTIGFKSFLIPSISFSFFLFLCCCNCLLLELH